MTGAGAKPAPFFVVVPPDIAQKAAMGSPDFSFEANWHVRGHRRVAGVDEVGRGPLAGPVMAAAVILDAACVPEGLDDSKRLSAKRRQRIAGQVHGLAQVAIGQASVAEIDTLNIRQATFLAMRRAIAGLPHVPDAVLIDGRDVPDGLPCPGQAIIKGDARSLSIAAASIVAKEARDQLMRDLDKDYPGFGWAQNAGYPTKAHREALISLGVTPHHRRSFKPVHNILYQENC